MTEKKQTLHEALFAVQQAAPFIDKATDNPFFKSKYASMPDIWSAIKDLLEENKLLVIHQPEVIDGADYIATTIHHIPSGDFLLSRSRILLSKSTAQEYGSYITYMRRYAVSAMLGLITDNDDDGNAASNAKPKPEPKTEPKPEPLKPVTTQEIALLKTGLATAKNLDELNFAKDNVKAAWKRLVKEQADDLTKAVNEATLRLAQAPTN